MAIDRDGGRDSRFATCLGAAAVYGLDRSAAREVISGIVGTIQDQWNGAADAARLTTVDKDYLWKRQILNPAAFYGYPS